MSIENQTIICDECENEFLLKSVKIQEVPIEEIDRNQLSLIYFTCPKCNRIYRVALKDTRYEELREDLEKTKKRIRKNHGSNNEEFARTLNNMVYKKQERLRKYAEKLNLSYSGTFAFVVSKNNPKEQTIKYLP